MTTSLRLLAHRAKSGNEAAAVKLAAALAARAESGQPALRLAHDRTAALPGTSNRSLAPVASGPKPDAKPDAPKPQLRLVAPKATTPARTAAQEADRSRIKAVLRSPHTHGRLDLAMALLNDECLSAEQILAHLPNALTDAQLAVRAKRDAIDDTWARAYGIDLSTSDRTADLITTTKAKASGDDVWARVYGSTSR